MEQHRYTVLLVDDDAALLRGLERHLSDQPFQLLTAVSAAEASAMLKRNFVDVIVSDNMMPGMTGTEFLSHVKVDYPHIVSIILSGNITVPVAMKAVNDIGVFRVLTKPCDVETLGGTILEAFQHKSQIRCEAADRE